MTADAELIGPQELAAILGISTTLVHQWRKRDKLPAADHVISGVPIWRFGSVRHMISEGK